jgi:hypothetical protein
MSSSRSPFPVPDNKKLCSLFFGKVPYDGSKDLWKCECGTIRKQNAKLGFSNLMSHIKQKHPNYMEVFQMTHAAIEEGRSETKTNAATCTRPVSKQATLDFVFDSHSNNIFKWLEWIVMDELELSFCEKSLTKANTKLQPVCARTRKKYMFKLVEEVERKITAKVEAAKVYSLVFDGWSEGSVHFVGMYISFPGLEPGAGFETHLLSFSPLSDETNFTAENHAKFIRTTLPHYSLSKDRLF